MKLYTELMNGDCIQLLENIGDESVDAVVTDPPYCYLNKKDNCDFDRRFDNEAFVAHCKRILKNTGFVVMFGRGESFYRLNTLFCDAGFKYKEDVVWNKVKNTSPFLNISRVHENIVIFTKKNGIIRKNFIPLFETINTQDAKNDIDIKICLSTIVRLIQSINAGLGYPKELHTLKEFFNGKKIFLNKVKPRPFHVTRRTDLNQTNRRLSDLQIIVKGNTEKDIINIPTIIKESKIKNVYHPTEKPVRLMERLISLVTDEGDVVLDPFMGSGTTGVACIRQNRHFVGIELDEKYFDVAYRRIEDEKRESVKSIFDVLDDETIAELQGQDALQA